MRPEGWRDCLNGRRWKVPSQGEARCEFDFKISTLDSGWELARLKKTSVIIQARDDGGSDQNDSHGHQFSSQPSTSKSRSNSAYMTSHKLASTRPTGLL